MPASPDRMDVWSTFLHAHAALTDVLESELQHDRELPLTWLDVLITLSNAPEGRLRMQELARKVLLSKSGLTRLFDRMEEAGLVRRESCAEDRRGTLAVLTTQGRRELRRAMPVHERGIRQHFARHLTDREAREMQDALEKILHALGRSHGGCVREDAPVRAARAR